MNMNSSAKSAPAIEPPRSVPSRSNIGIRFHAIQATSSSVAAIERMPAWSSGEIPADATFTATCWRPQQAQSAIISPYAGASSDFLETTGVIYEGPELSLKIHPEGDHRGNTHGCDQCRPLSRQAR